MTATTRHYLSCDAQPWCEAELPDESGTIAGLRAAALQEGWTTRPLGRGPSGRYGDFCPEHSRKAAPAPRYLVRDQADGQSTDLRRRYSAQDPRYQVIDSRTNRVVDAVTTKQTACDIASDLNWKASR